MAAATVAAKKTHTLAGRQQAGNNDSTEICQVADSTLHCDMLHVAEGEGYMMHIANVVCRQFSLVAAATILFMHEHECNCSGPQCRLECEVFCLKLPTRCSASSSGSSSSRLQVQTNFRLHSLDIEL